MAGDGASLTDQPAARYTGRRISTGSEVLRHAADGSTSPLPWRLDLRNHSPTGLEWGYGGSGPGQLALAILADAIGPREAQKYYYDFKCSMIAGIQQDSWEITREQILAWVGQQQGLER